MIWLVTVALAAPRPDAVGWVDSSEGRVRCHYGSDEVRPRCEQVAAWAERAWVAQVDGLGFRAPLPDAGVGGSDALDFYVIRTDGGAGNAWVDCEAGDPGCVDSDPTDGYAASPSYVVIDSRTSDDDFPLFVYHEFQHAIHYATDFAEPFLVLWESTAVAAEQWTDPAWATTPEDFGAFQDAPWLSVVLQDGYFLYDYYGIDSWYEYGAVAWLFFMDDRYGDGHGAIGPILWDAVAQEGEGLEPDVLDAWQQISGDWQASFLEFTADRARMGTAAGPDYAAFAGDYGLAMREGTLTDATVRPASPPFPLGVSYYDVPVEAGAEIGVAFGGDGLTQWAVLAIEADDYTILDATDTYRAGGPFSIAVVNLGPPGMDGDDALRASDFELTIGDPALVSGGSGGRCACASAGSGAAGWIGAAILALSRRRYTRAPVPR